MRKAAKRMYMSLLMLIVSVAAIGFTTYAWYAIASNSTFDKFTLNLRENEADDSEYGIQLSLDGKNFSDSIDPIVLKKQLLTNCGIDTSNFSDDNVAVEFNKLNLDQCTVTRRTQDSSKTEYNMFNDFYSFSYQQPIVTHKYFWFDLYVSLYRKDGETEPSDNYLDIYLREMDGDGGKLGIIDSGTFSTNTIAPIQMPYSNPYGREILGRGNPYLPLGFRFNAGEVNVKTATSARLAIKKYTPARIGHPEDLKNTTDLTIYRTGSEFPKYDSDTNTYDFGGVLEQDYNFAYLYHKQIGGYDFDFLEGYANFEDVLNRGDELYIDDGVSNHIVSKDDHCTTDKMARFTFYFWFEGWDSNCFDVINNHPVSINLAFTSKHPNTPGI